MVEDACLEKLACRLMEDRIWLALKDRIVLVGRICFEVLEAVVELLE